MLFVRFRVEASSFIGSYVLIITAVYSLPAQHLKKFIITINHASYFTLNIINRNLSGFLYCRLVIFHEFFYTCHLCDNIKLNSESKI